MGATTWVQLLASDLALDLLHTLGYFPSQPISSQANSSSAGLASPANSPGKGLRSSIGRGLSLLGASVSSSAGFEGVVAGSLDASIGFDEDFERGMISFLDLVADVLGSYP